MTNDQIEPSGNSELRNVSIALLAGGLLLFTCAYLVGYIAGTIAGGGPSTQSFLMIGALVAAIALVGFATFKFWPKTADIPISPSTAKSRNWLWAAAGAGVVIGIGFVALEGPDQNALFSNAPLTATAAAFGLFSWLVVVPIVTVMWWRSIDEHEADSYRDAAMIACHAFLFITPSWWLAERAGWLPAQDPMVTFLIVSAIWTAVWFYRKFR
jgi:hypothetical protein